MIVRNKSAIINSVECLLYGIFFLSLMLNMPSSIVYINIVGFGSASMFIISGIYLLVIGMFRKNKRTE
jgi:hypothetical protein